MCQIGIFNWMLSPKIEYRYILLQTYLSLLIYIPRYFRWKKCCTTHSTFMISKSFLCMIVTLLSQSSSRFANWIYVTAINHVYTGFNVVYSIFIKINAKMQGSGFYKVCKFLSLCCEWPISDSRNYINANQWYILQIVHHYNHWSNPDKTSNHQTNSLTLKTNIIHRHIN